MFPCRNLIPSSTFLKDFAIYFRQMYIFLQYGHQQMILHPFRPGTLIKQIKIMYHHLYINYLDLNSPPPPHPLQLCCRYQHLEFWSLLKNNPSLLLCSGLKINRLKSHHDVRILYLLVIFSVSHRDLSSQ